MQSERRYKIDKYLEMARITKSELKKDHYLDMAENYLETEDELPLTTKGQTTEWVNGLKLEDVLGKSVTDIYNEYIKYSDEIGNRVQSKISVSKSIREKFNLTSKRKRFSPEIVKMVFIEEEQRG